MKEYIVSGENLSGIAEAISDGELVRCKDCKHRPIQTEPGKVGFALEFPERSMCPFQCEDGYYSKYPGDNFFCGYGERKEGGTE